MPYVPALDHGIAGKLAEVCGGVPLALRLAACALLNRPDLTPEEYVHRLLDAQSRHDLLEAAFRVSFSLLDPILQMVWSRLGVFPSRFRPEAVLMSGWLFMAEASDLVTYGMLEHDPENALYRLPRSGRDLALSGLTEADRATAEQQVTELGEGMGEPFRPHAMPPEPSRLETAQRVARRCGYRSAEALYIEALADRLPNPPSAPGPLEQALALCRELGDRSAEVRILGKLVLLYKRSDERRAAGFGEQALVILRERGELREESLLLKEVCTLHKRLKNERRAIELCERDVDIYRELAVPWAEALALATLAGLHEELRDDRRAVEVHEQCLAIARKRGSQADIARGAYRISLIYRRLREFDKAIAALEVCVDAVRAIGWAPHAASAALGRSDTESLEVELERLRASRTI
jgi:tetratricopeptide (TPR) repeat protein